MNSTTGQRGFTLIELLIAMTLLGLLMLGLFGGLRLGARVWEAGDAQSADRARLEAVQRFIRTHLGQARPLVAADRTGDDLVAFIGRADRVDFAAVLPSYLGVGGFSHVSLSLANRGEGRALVVTYGLLRRRDDGRAELFELDRDAETSVLLENVESLEFSYFGVSERRDEARWTDRWDDEGWLPLLVRVRVGLADADPRVWPELTVALMVGDAEGERSPRERRR